MCSRRGGCAPTSGDAEGSARSGGSGKCAGGMDRPVVHPDRLHFQGLALQERVGGSGHVRQTTRGALGPPLPAPVVAMTNRAIRPRPSAGHLHRQLRRRTGEPRLGRPAKVDRRRLDPENQMPSGKVRRASEVGASEEGTGAQEVAQPPTTALVLASTGRGAGVVSFCDPRTASPRT